MGYLTTITVHNDALGAFQEDPKLFGEAILKGIDQANHECREVSVGFKGYCNYISVQHSRHADDNAVYVHHGNTVCVVSEYEQDFKEFMRRDPDAAMRFAQIALEHAKSAIKECKDVKAQKKAIEASDEAANWAMRSGKTGRILPG